MERQKLFFGNLNFTVTENDIQDLLSPYGKVIEIKLRQKKGYAFVEMSSPDEAALVMEKLDQTEFLGRPLRISPELAPKKARALAKEKAQIRSRKRSSRRFEDATPTHLTTKERPKSREGSTGFPKKKWGKQSGDFSEPGERGGYGERGGHKETTRGFSRPAGRARKKDDDQLIHDRRSSPAFRDGDRERPRSSSKPRFPEGGYKRGTGSSRPADGDGDRRGPRKPFRPRVRSGATDSRPRGGNKSRNKVG